MKKKPFLILFILILLVSVGIIYLNNVFLPTKIKSIIIEGLQEQTQKKVSLESLQFNIFKGLVLRNLIIYDDKKPIVTLKEGFCTFLILPVFKKMIIIPTLSLKSPEIFLERRPDNTFNIQDLFLKKSTQAPKAEFSPLHSRYVRGGFSIFVYRVSVRNANIYFQDDTLTLPFSKNLQNLNLNLYPSLPINIKFNLKSEITATPLINIMAQGEFRIPEKELSAKISIQDFAPREFLEYYQNLGINIPGGLINCLINLKFKDNILYADMAAQNKNLNISKEKFQALLNSDIKANLQYSLKDKKLGLSGKAKVFDSKASGLELVDEINKINGEVIFNNSGIFSDKLSASVLGVPIAAQVKLADFNNPLIDINIASSLNLATAGDILKDKFKFAFPGDIKGEGNLFLTIQTKIPSSGILQINGYLDISNATLKLEKLNSPFEDINGRIEFSQNQLRWSLLNFKYLGLPYKTTGILTNFQAPCVQLELSSKALSLESSFAIDNKLINVSRLSGKYLNSEFSLTGSINPATPPNLYTDISGELDIELRDIKELLKKFQTQLKQINPDGLMHAQFSLNGNINDFKSCFLQAKLSGDSITAYGLKAKEFLLNYNQADGIIDISPIHLSLYDGTIEANGKMNLSSENLPYWITADIQGVKLEKLKLDTAAKEKDIAGTIQAQVKINGFSNDLSMLSGAGKINIVEGKLWQLNLFKGLGTLLFAKDFADIVFHEGSSGFLVQDKYISSDDLKLKSNITDLSGSVKIGFDTSIDASLNVEVLDEMVPLSGTFKDVTTAIIGQSGRFGVIKISGTLKEPKYKFQPTVVDIIKGLKESIFGK